MFDFELHSFAGTCQIHFSIWSSSVWTVADAHIRRRAGRAATNAVARNPVSKKLREKHFSRLQGKD